MDIGFFVGILIGLLFLFLGAFALNMVCNTTAEKIIKWIARLMAISSIIIGTVLGINSDNYDLKEDIDGYIAVKDTYESVITDSNLTSLERLQIVNTAIEQNMLLAQRKASIDAWWNFGIDKELKNELKALKLIKS